MMIEPTERPPVSVIVCTAGRGALLPDCLRSILATLRDGDELILVESRGNSGSQVLDELGPAPANLSYVHVEPPGKSRQLNAGIRRSRADILLFTDDDARVPPTWSTQMADCFADESVGMAFGPVTGLSRVPGTTEAPVPHPGEAPVETWGFAHGAAMALRRQAVFQCGGFDERLGPGAPAHGEEHDLVLRVREHGWRVVIASAESVEHLEWRTGEENRLNALVYERGAGAVVGACLRRSLVAGLPVLRGRLAYQRNVFSWNPSFGPSALAAFGSGLWYGLRLQEKDWLGRESDVRPRAAEA